MMRSTIFIFLCFAATNAIEEVENFAAGAVSPGHGSGGGRGGGRGGSSGGKSPVGGKGSPIGGGGGSKPGPRSGAQPGVVPPHYFSFPYYYRVYFYYHGYHSHEDYGLSEPQLPAATAQDQADAANIVNAQFSEKVIASILALREPIHRQVINSEIAKYNHGKRLIQPKYKPNRKNNSIFTDLCFGLVNDPITVLAMYLGEFLHRRDETFIIIILTLCQEMGALHYIYNHKHKNGLRKRRIRQRHPFANLMKVWIANDRDSEDSAFTPQNVNDEAESLKKEYPHWKKNRDILEDTLISKSLKFGLAVIQKFEADLGISIEKAIENKKLNHDLADAYISLALYVKDKYNYMAKTMLAHSDGTDRWAVWIMMIGITIPDDWPEIDDAFKKINDGVSLKDHILKTTDADQIPFEMMAQVIDPQYKATF